MGLGSFTRSPWWTLSVPVGLRRQPVEVITFELEQAKDAEFEIPHRQAPGLNPRLVWSMKELTALGRVHEAISHVRDDPRPVTTRCKRDQ